ncbi:hypothetical protein WI73_11470 [Burkholderia ubonensis]|uniref:hypothetical protein n=1 Tax=Burkholderia ubonensis TaxID=101571 RepID=UPI00076C6479|nr:hypothetical protein [Burkholderia ubonensis]KVC71431.1 hypothetical protein WI73_11470 [Burkholderia ubonensis]
MNCKPGDLAYLSSDCVAEGLVVEVLTSAGMTAAGAPAWHCRSRTPIDCITERTQRVVSVTEFAVEDRYLRPISGVPVTDGVSDEVAA